MFCRNLFIYSSIRLSTRNCRSFSAFSRSKDKKECLRSVVFLANGSASGNLCWHKIHLRHFSFGTITEKLNPKPSTISFEISNSDEEVLKAEEVIPKNLDQESLNLDNFFGEATSSVSDTAANLATETLNLTTWLPPNGIYHLLSYLHESCPWWASIVIATCVAKALVFPLIIAIQKSSIKMAQDTGRIVEIQQKMTEALNKQDETALMVAQHQLNMEMKKLFGSSRRFVWKPLLNGAIFSSFFFALREMASHPIMSMKTGGLYWFTDLTASDPYFILPIITSSTLFYVLKSGIEFGSTNNPMVANQMKWMSYLLPPVTFVVMINFPSALCLYWCTNNFISLLQSSLLRNNAVRNYFGIPKLESLSTTPIKGATSFKEGKEGFNQSWNQAAFAQTVKERKALFDKLTSIKQTK